MDQPARLPESPAAQDQTRTEASPTPARQGIEPPSQDRDRDHGAEGSLRSFRSGEEEWFVRESGRTASGRGTDPRVLLTQLAFARGTEPDQPVREILVAERRLGDLTDHELSLLLGRSRPYVADQDRKGVFTDARKKGRKGR